MFLIIFFDLIFQKKLLRYIVFFTFLLSAFPAFSQEIQLSGTVSCTDCTSGVQGISVLVYPDDIDSAALLVFTFTDYEGEFDLRFKNPVPNSLDSVRVLFRSLQFADTDTTLHLPDESGRIHLEITLQEKVQKLEEVVVQARRPLFEVRGDTLHFFIDNHKDPYDRSLNDLLDRLPGLEVDHESGNIRFLGNTVSYLLLDGDDLTGNHYGDLGRILHPDDVEGIQLITDYHQNRLLKGLQTGEIALNIELKDSLLIKPKITLSAGGLVDDRMIGQIQPEVLALQQTHKWVISAGTLNTGDDFSAFRRSSVDEIVQGGQQLNGRNFLSAIHHESDLPRSAYIKNRQTYLNINHLYSNDDMFRWQTSLQTDLQDGGMRREVLEEFLNPALELNERVSDTDMRFDHIKLRASTTVEKDFGEHTRSETHLGWRYFDQNSNSRFTNPLAANGSELAHRKQRRFELKQELTHRTVQEKLYTARFEYVQLSADHRKKFSQILAQMPEFDGNGYQDLLEDYNHANVHLETSSSSFLNTRINTFLNAGTKREEIGLARFSSPFIFSNLPEIELQGQLVKYREVAAGQQYSNQSGRFHWFLSPSLKFTQIRIGNSSSSNSVLGAAEAKIQLDIDSSSSFSVELQRHHESPVSQIFLAFPILQSNQSIIQGSMQPDLIPTNRISANLRYFGTEVNDPLFLIMGSITHRERSLVVDQQIEPEFTFNKYRINKKSGITGVVMASLSQDFSALNLGYKSDISFLYHEFLISQQDSAPQLVQSWIWNPSLTIFYRYQRRLVLESGISWGQRAFKSPEFATQEQQEGRITAKVDIRMRQLQLVTNYQHIRPDLNHSTDVQLLDTELRYRSNLSSLVVRLIFNNLLNQTHFDRIRLTDIGTLSSRLDMIPRSGILEFSWSF